MSSFETFYLGKVSFRINLKYNVGNIFKYISNLHAHCNNQLILPIYFSKEKVRFSENGTYL
jgi:hypothetical protein